MRHVLGTCLQLSVWNCSFTGHKRIWSNLQHWQKTAKKNMLAHGVTLCMKAPASLLYGWCTLRRLRLQCCNSGISLGNPKVKALSLQWFRNGKRPRLHLWNSITSSFTIHSLWRSLRLLVLLLTVGSGFNCAASDRIVDDIFNIFPCITLSRKMLGHRPCQPHLLRNSCNCAASAWQRERREKRM